MTRIVSPGSNAGMSVRKPSRATSANRSMVGSSVGPAFGLKNCNDSSTVTRFCHPVVLPPDCFGRRAASQ
jgi:hypothetical protein